MRSKHASLKLKDDHCSRKDKKVIITSNNWNVYDPILPASTLLTIQAIKAQVTESTFISNLLSRSLENHYVQTLLGGCAALDMLRVDPESSLLIQPLTSTSDASLVSLIHPHTALTFKDKRRILTVHETKILKWASQTLDPDSENIFVALIAARLFMGAFPGSIETYQGQIDETRILPAMPGRMVLMPFLGECDEDIPNWKDLLEAFARATSTGDNRMGRLSFLLASVLFSVMENLSDARDAVEAPADLDDKTRIIEDRLYSILHTIPHHYLRPFERPESPGPTGGGHSGARGSSTGKGSVTYKPSYRQRPLRPRWR